ncbi:jg8287 [Pararge aegeria aegeria]|uniref:Jg8287 protein n=1 Tax=Pararge aegeria aegeria TaxID=348720 RepID=A0A8S4RA53_9NEOP|nr:jg8287 [Pararge aegeria aegeria]
MLGTVYFCEIKSKVLVCFSPSFQLTICQKSAPPNAVEIINHPHNSKLEMKEGEDVVLECQVKNAKPAAKIVWYRGNQEMKGDKVSSEEIKEVEGPTGNPKSTRYTSISRVHFKAMADDDYADFTCEARHEALQRDTPMRSTVQLSVLYPPGAPYIEGYAEGETVRRGQSLELVCRSRGGNPPAQLIWYKNGEQIRMAYSFEKNAFFEMSRVEHNLNASLMRRAKKKY